MKVRDCMTREVVMVGPEESIGDAARKMAECDAGALPVQHADKLIGMVTDRDIAVRAVAKDLPPATPVRDVMSHEVLYCFEDEDIGSVAENMGIQQIRRLPVVSRDKRLVGIISLGDIATGADTEKSGQALGYISRRGGKHDQTLH